MEVENAEMAELAEIHKQEIKKKDGGKAEFFDRIFNQLQQKVIVVGQNGLQEFPKVVCIPGQDVTFKSGYDQIRNIFEV